MGVVSYGYQSASTNGWKDTDSGQLMTSYQVSSVTLVLAHAAYDTRDARFAWEQTMGFFLKAYQNLQQVFSS